MENGLVEGDRKAYYSMDEGIQYLPVDVLASMKRAKEDGFAVVDELFFAKPERMGLLPNYMDTSSDLPLGITVSQDKGFVPMAGINCATCHTSLIMNDKGEFFLVDGGSSQFAIDRFIEGMVRSLVATMVNPSEFEAFYQRYQTRVASHSAPLSGAKLAQGESPLDTGSLGDKVREAYATGNLEALEKQIAKMEPDSKALRAARTHLDSAYPTKDALSTRLGMYTYLVKRFIFFFGQTSNASKPDGSKVGLSGLGRSNPWSVTKRMFGAHLGSIQKGAKSFTPAIEGGPVNTPHMWDHDRQKWIFWTGVTNSMLERNLAQGVALVTDFDWGSYETTVSIRKLEEVSKLARKPKAPKWPEAILGPIDQTAAVRGKEVYRTTCLSCHDPKAGATATGSAEFNYVNVGTDDSYFRGQMEMMGGYDLFTGVIAPFIGKVKLEDAKREGITDLAPFETGRLPIVWRRPETNAVVAKPLAGIWATAPFLHNGSVPTIADLLKPAADRPKNFWVGSFKYDTAKLGFANEETVQGFQLVVRCDTGCEGNDNRGHEIGTTLSDQDKKDLIEFLKSYSDVNTPF